MKLMVSAKPFTADLKSVLPAIANRSGLPMLSGVRLEVSEGEVAIEATDLEFIARRVVRGEVTVDGAGSIVVPAKALAKAVAAMGEPEIVLESCDGRPGLDVRAGSRTVTLQGWPTDDVRQELARISVRRTCFSERAHDVGSPGDRERPGGEQEPCVIVDHVQDLHVTPVPQGPVRDVGLPPLVRHVGLEPDEG